MWKNNNQNVAYENIVISNELSENKLSENKEDFVETSQTDEKLSYNAEFALKKYYDECGHFTFQYSELPIELVNLTRQEIEDLYDDWEVETFSSDTLVLSQEINNFCDEHYMIKLGENNIEIYNVGNGGSLSLYKETDISKEYLTNEDINTLEEGIYVYGKGKLNATIEDFE
jgi:hypothetical protein